MTPATSFEASYTGHKVNHHQNIHNTQIQPNVVIRISAWRQSCHGLDKFGHNVVGTGSLLLGQLGKLVGGPGQATKERQNSQKLGLGQVTNLLVTDVTMTCTKKIYQNRAEEGHLNKVACLFGLDNAKFDKFLLGNPDSKVFKDDDDAFSLPVILKVASDCDLFVLKGLFSEVDLIISSLHTCSTEAT